MIRQSKAYKSSDKASDYLNYSEAKKTAENLINKSNRIGLLIMFGINTGLRYSDLSKLHDNDIAKAIYNNNELVLFEKKTGKKRIIYLNKLCIDSYNKFPKVGYLFRSQKGTIYDISYINKVLKKLFKSELNKNISTHSLRKTFARTLYDNAQDKEDALVRLNGILNHTEISDTRIYLGITKEENNLLYKSFEIMA